MQNNIYDAQFRGNILIVGKTGCEKTRFVQKLGLNNKKLSGYRLFL